MSRNRLTASTICTLIQQQAKEPGSKSDTRGCLRYKEHVLLTSRRLQIALLATYRAERVTFRYYRSLLDYW